MTGCTLIFKYPICLRAWRINFVVQWSFDTSDSIVLVLKIWTFWPRGGSPTMHPNWCQPSLSATLFYLLFCPIFVLRDMDHVAYAVEINLYWHHVWCRNCAIHPVLYCSTFYVLCLFITVDAQFLPDLSFSISADSIFPQPHTLFLLLCILVPIRWNNIEHLSNAFPKMQSSPI